MQGSPPPALLPALGLSEYEQKRAEVVRRNRLMFEQTLAGGEAPGEGQGGGEAGGRSLGQAPEEERTANLDAGAAGAGQESAGFAAALGAGAAAPLPAVDAGPAPSKRKHSSSGKKSGGKKTGSKKKKAHGVASPVHVGGAGVSHSGDAERGPSTPAPTQPRRSLCVLCRKTGGTACMVVSGGLGGGC